VFHFSRERLCAQNAHSGKWRVRQTCSARSVEIVFYIRIFGAFNQILKQQTTFSITLLVSHRLRQKVKHKTNKRMPQHGKIPRQRREYLLALKSPTPRLSISNYLVQIFFNLLYTLVIIDVTFSSGVYRSSFDIPRF